MYSLYSLWLSGDSLYFILLQLDSEKCTGRYFKVKDDDLSTGVNMYIQNYNNKS